MASMDGIIDTVSATHAIPPLLGLLKSNGKMILVGAPDKPLEVPAFALIFGNYIFSFHSYKLLQFYCQLVISISMHGIGYIC